MRLERVDPRTHPGWATLIDRMPSDVFHSPAWLSVLAETYGWSPSAYVLFDDDGEPRAGVPFCRVTDMLGDRIVSLPFSDYCDPLADDPSAWNGLSDGLRAHGRPVVVRCLHSPLPLADTAFGVYKQARWHGIDLTPDLDRLWNEMTSPARKNVRRSEREGVRIRPAADAGDLQTFFGMHLAVRKYKYGLLAQPRAFFENIWRHFVERGCGYLLLATYQDRVLGGVFLLKWKDTLYYKFNASERSELNLLPNDQLIWESIKHGKALGCSRFDLGLSDWDQAGLIRFKRKFGAAEKTISFLRHAPDVDAPPYETEARGLLAGMTRVFVDERVPDAVTERAGAALYRFFV